MIKNYAVLRQKKETFNSNMKTMSALSSLALN
jgi:hypothetical protein